MNICGTSILDQTYLDDDESQASNDDDESLASNYDDENSMDDPEDVFELIDLEYDLDNVMATTVQALKPRGFNPNQLSKNWRISHGDAKNTIDVTMQASIQKDNPVLSRNYSTIDRMLRYKRIKDFFFKDTFFVTKKGCQSSRGHTC